MSVSKQLIIDAANAEWETWGRSIWNLVGNTSAISHTDDEESFVKLIVTKYCSLAGGSPTIDDISDDRYYWSAVGMSYIMHRAGFNKSEFPFSQRHSTWIRRFIAARRSDDDRAAYFGYRSGEAGGAPDLGDLIAYGRGKGVTVENVSKLYDANGSYESHSDVVVAKRPGSIDVIGCNVKDSVTKEILPTNADGHVIDTAHPWFAVLKLRAA